MDYCINRDVLTEVVKSGEVIRPEENHHKADGSMDIDSSGRQSATIRDFP